MLALAPRFLAFAGVSTLLMLVQMTGQCVLASALLTELTTDDPFWKDYVSNLLVTIYGQIVFACIVSFGVPIVIVFLFERMLHSELGLFVEFVEFVELSC